MAVTSKKVTRWQAGCGKGFWNRAAAEYHDEACKCWTHPKNRACRTCKYAKRVNYESDTDSGGYFECQHKNGREEHQGAPDGVDYISVNCYLWEKSHMKRV